MDGTYIVSAKTKQKPNSGFKLTIPINYTFTLPPFPTTRLPSSGLDLCFLSNPCNKFVTFMNGPISINHELTEHQLNEIQKLQKLEIYHPAYSYSPSKD